MRNPRQPARINTKLLLTLVIIVGVLAAAAAAGYKLRKRSIARTALANARAAVAAQDWETARKEYRRNLERYPDNLGVLREYAAAELAVRPLWPANVNAAIAAYRRIVRLDRPEEMSPAEFEEIIQHSYGQLGRLYWYARDAEQLAYIATQMQQRWGGDAEAPQAQATLWLASARMAQRRSDEAETMLTKLLERLATRSFETADGPRAQAWQDVIRALADRPRGAADALERRIAELSLPVAAQPDFVEACLTLAKLRSAREELAAVEDAKLALDLALAYEPDSAETLVRRATLWRSRAERADADQGRFTANARADLESAMALPTAAPRVCLALAAEWAQHGELERAQAALARTDALSPDEVLDDYVNPGDWTAAKFVVQVELELRRRAYDAAADLADAVVRPGEPATADLRQQRHRAAVLPTAIRAYVLAGRPDAAQQCLSEYEEIFAPVKLSPEQQADLALLRANVARSRRAPYNVIEHAEAVVARGADQPGAWRLLAGALLETGQARRAIAALEQCVRLAPTDAELTLELARQYHARGDWRKARDAARRAEALRPNDVGAAVMRIAADVELAARQPDDTADKRLAELSAELAALPDADAGHTRIPLLRAVIAAYQGRTDEVVAQLARVSAESGDALTAELVVLKLYTDQRKFDQALEFGRAACKRYPTAAEPWLAVADVHVARNEYDAARRTLEEAEAALAGDPAERRRVVLALGRLELLEPGSQQTGLARLKRLAAEDPADVEVRVALLSLPRALQDQKYAQQLINELRGIEGESGLRWRLHQAAVWMMDENWRVRRAEIEELLSECIVADPGWIEAALQIGSMHELLGEPALAERAYRRLLEAQPRAAEVASRLLNLLQQQGRFREAQDVVGRLDVDPLTASGLQMGVAYRAGDLESAIQASEATVAVAPGNADAHVVLADLKHQRARGLARLIQELEGRIAADSSDAQARARLAGLKTQRDRDQQAVQDALDRAAELNPNLILLAAVRARIHEAENERDRARQVLDELVAQDGTPAARRLRAEFLTSIGDLDAAEAEYRALTEIPDSPRSFIELCEFYRDHDRLDDSIAALERGRKVYPDYVDLTGTLINALMFRGRGDDRQRATELLNELAAQRPTEPAVLWARARSLLAQPDPNAAGEAETLLLDVINRRPTHAEAHLALIELAARRGEFDEARQRAGLALGALPGDTRLQVAHARVELAARDARTAWKLASGAFERDAASDAAADMLVQAAVAYGDRDALEETHARLVAAVAENPLRHTVQLGAARVLQALGRIDDAIASLERYRAQDGGEDALSTPARLATLLTLAELYRVGGDFQSAGARVEAAAALAPDSPAVFAARIQWMAGQEDFDGVLDFLGQHRASQPDDFDTLVVGANALVSSQRESDRDAGRALLEEMVATQPGYVPAHSALGSLAYREGDLARAERAYRSILEYVPQDPAASNDLAWVLAAKVADDAEMLTVADLARLEEALQLARMATAADPMNMHFLDTRGVVLSKHTDRQHLREARDDLERCYRAAAENTAERARAALTFSRVLIRLDEAAAARNYLEECHRIDQDQDVLSSGERALLRKLLSVASGADRR